MKSLVIIPAFNEEGNIIKVVSEINEYGYDYIVINDCSTDSTGEILDNYAINHLDLSINVGLAGVTKIGFMYADECNYDVAVVIDGDGQHNPKYINELLQEIRNGNDYVVGSRFVTEKKDVSIRMLGSRLLSFFIKIKTGMWVGDPTSGMRALSKNLIKDFANGMNFIAEPDALTYVLHHRYKFKEVQVFMRNREEGDSYFKSPFKSIKFMFEVIISILFVQW